MRAKLSAPSTSSTVTRAPLFNAPSGAASLLGFSRSVTLMSSEMYCGFPDDCAAAGGSIIDVVSNATMRITIGFTFIVAGL